MWIVGRTLKSNRVNRACPHQFRIPSQSLNRFEPRYSKTRNVSRREYRVHTFISLLPILLLAVLLFAAIGSNNLLTQVVGYAGSLSPAIGNIAETTLESE